MFFNERFEFVQENSTALRVSVAGDGTHTLELDGIKAPKNGYVYVYLSNENDDPVYFDNFIVQDDRGRIIEEDHYYPYGLKIAGISSTKLPDPNEGNIENKYLYNDKELFDDADLDWYDYGYRNYDPQIARFTQLDPLTWEYPELTNYQYASDEPIANVDVDGLEAATTIKTLQTVVVHAVKRTSVELAKTSSHLVPLAMAGISIASHLVQIQLEVHSIGRNFSDPGIRNELNNEVYDYYSEHKNELSLMDYWVLNNLAGNYFQGLNDMAFWSSGDFEKLNRAVINSVLPDELKIQLVQLGIEDAQEAHFSLITQGASTALFLSAEALFPEVGAGPKGSMLKYKILPQVPKAKMNVLEGAVNKNFRRFLRSIPANSKSSASWRLMEDGNYLFEATSPGRVPGSRAVYQKWVDPEGQTFKMIKTTYDPQGNIAHIKPKF